MPISLSWASSKCSSSWLYEINSSSLPLLISKIKIMFSTLWPLSWSIISTTFLVTLALCLSPFYSGGKRNVLLVKSVGSKVGIGLDPDGFTSSLDLMKTVGVFGLVGSRLRLQLVIQRKFYLQKGQKMQKPPLHVVQAYGWEWNIAWV